MRLNCTGKEAVLHNVWLPFLYGHKKGSLLALVDRCYQEANNLYFQIKYFFLVLEVSRKSMNS